MTVLDARPPCEVDGRAPDSAWAIEPQDQPGHWTIIHQASGQQTQAASDASVVHELEFQAIRDLVALERGILTLHAALLCNGEQGMLIVGPSHAGKSTLATALWQKGWSLLGDDVCLLCPDGLSLKPVRRRVSLRSGSRRLLPDKLWHRISATPSFQCTSDGGWLFHPDEVSAVKPPASCRLKAVLFLARRGVHTPPGEARRIQPAEALLALAPYSNVARFESMGESLRRLEGLVGATPCFDLGRTSLPGMVAAIERICPGQNP